MSMRLKMQWHFAQSTASQCGISSNNMCTKLTVNCSLISSVTQSRENNESHQTKACQNFKCQTCQCAPWPWLELATWQLTMNGQLFEFQFHPIFLHQNCWKMCKAWSQWLRLFQCDGSLAVPMIFLATSQCKSLIAFWPSFCPPKSSWEALWHFCWDAKPMWLTVNPKMAERGTQKMVKKICGNHLLGVRWRNNGFVPTPLEGETVHNFAPPQNLSPRRAKAKS